MKLTTAPRPKLLTPHLILRLPIEADIQHCIQYYRENDAHLSPFSPVKPDDFYTEDFWKKRIETIHSDFDADKAVWLSLFSRNSPELVGTIEFSQISRGPFQACYLGYGIAKKHEGKGWMTEATKVAIQYAIKEHPR